MPLLTIDLQPKQFPPSRAGFTSSQLLDTLGYFYSFSNEKIEQSPAGRSRPVYLRLYYGPPDQSPHDTAIIIPEQSSVSPGDLLVALGDPNPDHHVQPAAGPGGRWFWTYDLIQAAFYLLSRQEELEVAERDALDRFSTEHSLLNRLGLIERPVLNEAALILDSVIQQVAAERQIPLLRKSTWPHPCRYAVSLSHDVDDLGYRDPVFALRCLGQFVRTRRFHALRKGLGTLLQWGRNRLTGCDYARWYFDEWLRLEDEAGFRSTFYLVAASDDKSSYDPNYDIAEPRLAAQLRFMAKRGWEIGAHGSFDSYRSAQRICAERQRLQGVLGTPVDGIRQHYLRLALPDTWVHQELAGFRYDATLGFRDRLGFRAGLTTPFTAYNLSADDPFSLLELPLTVMDTVLFQRQNLSPEAAFATVQDCARRVQEVQGLLTVLWHQHVFEPVYRKFVLHLARESTVYVAPMTEVARWWQARQHLTLAADAMTAHTRRLILRAGRAIPDRVCLDIGGAGWQLVQASTGDLIPRGRAGSRPLDAIVLPPMAQNQTVTLEFKPESD